MNKSRRKKGQFIIVAAVLILLVLISTLVFLYSNLPTTAVSVQNFLGSEKSVEQAIQKVYASSVSYYGSILNVTGNVTYARQQANLLTVDGFNHLSTIFSSYGLTMSASNPVFSADWYSTSAYTYVEGVVHFNLSQLGLSGLSENATQELEAQIVCPPRCASSNEATVNVTSGGNQPVINLGPSNFFFKVFSADANAWVQQPVASVVNYGNGTYSMHLPSSSSSQAYILGIEDNRGILVVLSSYSKLTYTLSWPSGSSSLSGQPIVMEFLNDGQVRWLEQNLKFTSSTSIPIPPVPVKDLLVNETPTGGKSAYVPFQVEDWASNYTVPLGLAGNLTLFSNFQMIVVEAYTNTQTITISWNGLDSTNQTPYSIPGTVASGKYFTAPGSNTFTNSNIKVQMNTGGSVYIQVSTMGGSSLASVYFVRVDGVSSTAQGGYTETLIPGVVRDILQVEPENQAGFGNAYDTYFQVVVLIPAKTNWVQTFQRVFFVNDSSSVYPRSVNDAMLSKLIPSSSSLKLNWFIQAATTPTSNVYAEVSTSSAQSFNQSTPNGEYHLWGVYCSGSVQSGHDPCASGYNVGYLMTTSGLMSLYYFPANFSSKNPCSAGVRAQAGSSPYAEVDPLIPNSGCGGISFYQTYTVSWSGMFWFWPSGQSSQMDPYMLSVLVESPLSVSVSAQ
jgi:hypothetical protein